MKSATTDKLMPFLGCVFTTAVDGSDVVTICGEESAIVQGLTFVMQKVPGFTLAWCQLTSG
jgi:hypothetical protein